ncbi:evolutionarily conserved signaling intermediate in Toll pathway, mitochondrial-like isoform X2 [Penaeus japonicus]|uniref:Evolutionarily conserved signaling intermediate in Toll pathway, mitochondrial n=2 Tax=Penaeus japonicus TaxID=27405 RepID=A0A097F5U1_PENJP|nr:evolutionarily conserved signaling intermediate in Toll pathway, mitochondrial-like isoform X2 [Penaeus japonicus]AIT17846.1 ECSIT1 [Penaeus japonicus]
MMLRRSLHCGRWLPRVACNNTIAEVFSAKKEAAFQCANPQHTICHRKISYSSIRHVSREKRENETRVSLQGYFSSDDKSKETFIAACQVFKEKSKHLRGHVEFIYAALRHMEEFGVQKDLETYKELLDLMPKGKMIPQNIFQAEFMHYPKQQQCAIDVLEQMETNGVMPDTEMEMILMNSFGKYSHPVRKYGRMMYWMPKFKNASPWSLPDVVSNDAFDLAKMAVARMCTVDSTSKITTYDTKDVEDAVDDTWIISGQSVIQQELLEKLPHGDPIKVEGPFRIFLRDKSVGYFILRAEARPPPVPQKKEDKDDVGSIKFWFTGEFEEEVEETTVAAPQSIHEQEDGVILAICATGTSSRDSLLSWIRLLEATNPNISNLPVLFTQASPVGEVMVSDEQAEGQVETTA